MHRTIHILAGVTIAAGLLVPLFADALGTSFGGKIITVVPCISALGPSLWFTIAPAGVFSVAYIWTPATITKLAGPPRNPGQQVLGVADIPYVCTVGVGHFSIPFFGQRVQLIGTSAVF